jgi:hypothetical protein
MIRKLRRWLRRKAGKRVLVGLLVLLFAVAIVGQLLGWWSGILRNLQGTVIPSQIVTTSFEATAMGNRVMLTWETEIEENNQGFDLFRHEGGPFIRLNQDLIPSKALEGSEGALYTFIDNNVVAGTEYNYWIESVDRYGFRENQGHLIIEVQPPGASPILPEDIFLPLVLGNSP